MDDQSCKGRSHGNRRWRRRATAPMNAALSFRPPYCQACCLRGNVGAIGLSWWSTSLEPIARSSTMWSSAAANSMRDDVALECRVTFPGMAARLVDLLLQVRNVCPQRRAKSA
jgi:hypothetical protein